MSNDQRHPVDLLADEFANRLRAGENVSIDEYVASHPDLCDLIRAVFPSIETIERARQQQDSNRENSRAARSPSVETQSMIPTNLGDFRILCEIGRGGMGVVYEAEQQSLKRHVALKVMSDLRAGSDLRRERFRREAEAAAGLHHTNIVAVFGTGEESGFLYYAMQLIRGVPLSDVIHRLREESTDAKSDHSATCEIPICIREIAFAGGGSQDFSVAEHQSRTQENGPPSITQPFSESQTLSVRRGRQETRSTFSHPLSPSYYRFVANIIASAASGLQYAHHAGVLHRDIKPSNLMLDHDGTLWITDFGVAKRSSLDDMTQTGEIVGTLRYMAPEQLHGNSDARSDIYSLGLTLFELLTLRPAINASTGKWLEATAKGDIPKPRSIRREIPLDLELIVLKACAAEPSHRYATAGDFEQDLRRFIEDRPILAKQESIVGKFRRTIRRNPTVSLLTMASLILLSMIAVLLAIGNHQKQTALMRVEEEFQRAETNLQEKSFALQVADRERSRAANNLAMALEAFESVIANIGLRGGVESLLDDLSYDESIVAVADAGLSDADVKLLENLLQFFDRFAVENGTDLSLEAAAVQRRLGDIYHRLGRLDESTEAYRRALGSYQSMRESTQSEGALLFIQIENEIEVMTDLMTVAASRGRMGEVVLSYNSATNLLKRSTDGADSAEGRFALAKLSSTMAALGNRFGRTNRMWLDQAWNRRGPVTRAFDAVAGPITQAKLEREQRANTQALGLLRQLNDEDPSNIAYRLSLARTLREEMRLAQASKDQQRSDAAIEEANEIFSQLCGEFPDSITFKYELAQTLRAGIQIVNPDAKQYQRAAKICDELVRANPDSVDYRALRSSTLSRVAALMFSSPEKRENAIELMKQAIDDQRYLVSRTPSSFVYRLAAAQSMSNLAEALVGVGKRDDASAMMDEAIAILEPARGKTRSMPILQRLETRRDAIQSQNP